MTRRFQKVDVEEPSVSDTVEILRGLKSHYEDHHNVKYSLNALKSAVELSSRYMMDRFLPDKAIDVIDEAGAFRNMNNADGKAKKQIYISFLGADLFRPVRWLRVANKSSCWQTILQLFIHPLLEF